MVKIKSEYDVIVLGGGLAGMTMAATLGVYGFNTVCLEAQKPQKSKSSPQDIRTTAISYGSHNVLKKAGIWTHLEKYASPIKNIHIMDGTSPGLLEFDSKEVEGKPFGWIIENGILREGMQKTLKKLKNVDHVTGFQVAEFKDLNASVSVTSEDGKEVSAKLLIGADGRHSPTREWLGIDTKAWDYDQQALVFVVEHENPHQNIAVEHFRKEGPFAILPMVDGKKKQYRSSVVWTEHGTSKSYKDFDDTIFNAAIAERFPDFYGSVKVIGSVAAWPLKFMRAKSYTGNRTALIAEAAHVMHPIAGQGLNMSIRDIAALIEVIHGTDDPGQVSLLERYQSLRMKDNISMGMVTDGLNKLFSNNVSGIQGLRRFGLGLVKKTPPAKQFFMRQAMGHMGFLPSLLKGEDLAA